MRNPIKALVVATVCFGTTMALLADPRPGANPPKRGTYQTNWGKAEFEYDSGPRTLGLTGKFFFADGHIIWGTFFPVRRGDPPSAWTLTANYVLKTGNRDTAPPAGLSGATRCATKIPRSAPTNVRLPNSHYWGAISISFNTSGTHLVTQLHPCSTGVGAARDATRAITLTGSWIGETTYTSRPIAPSVPTVPKSQ